MGRKLKHDKIPPYSQLFKSVVLALKQLGGSGTIEEINGKVYEIENFSQDILEIQHDENYTEIDYRLAWARTYLKKATIIENSKRGVWALSEIDIDENSVDSAKIMAVFREQKKLQGENDIANNVSIIENAETSEFNDWRDKLIHILYEVPPAAFERLTQRLLRENGFTQVEVTGKVGDGGIDGKGIVRINGFLSFHIIFQCKRYKGSITASQIRDFRGAMQGRADKGLFITTGSFTREAIKEATRDGAPPIDLLDGKQLCEKLKEMQLGLSVELVEVVQINKDWFDKL